MCCNYRLLLGQPRSVSSIFYFASIVYVVFVPARVVAGLRSPCSVGNGSSILCDGRTPPCMKSDWHFLLETTSCLRTRTHDWAWPGAPGDAPGRGHALPIIFERHWAHATITWNGDSVADEAYTAMVCELRAHGFEVSIQSRGSSRDISPARVAAFFAGAEVFNTTVWWNKGVPETGFYVHETDTFVVRKGWGIYVRSDVQAQMELVDILVTSWGLHYPPEKVEGEDAFGNTMYGSDMTELFELARSWKGQLVIKEVSAQHFRATGSYVRRPRTPRSPSHRATHPSVCVPRPTHIRPRAPGQEPFCGARATQHTSGAQYPHVLMPAPHLLRRSCGNRGIPKTRAAVRARR